MMIRIYVANLEKYNNGELAGEWVGLPMDSGNLEQTLTRIAWRPNDDEGSELAIHDYDAPFHIGEHDNIEKLNELAEVLADEYDHDSENVVEAILRALEDETLDQKIEVLRDREFSVYENVTSMSDVAQAIFEEHYGEVQQRLEGMPSPVCGVNMASYIDFEAMGRDLEINGGFDFYHDLEVCIVR